MDIDEIVKSLSFLSEEVSKIKTKKKDNDYSIEQHKKLISIAKKYPISSHILKDCDETIQNDYIAGLIYLFDTNDNDTIELQRRLIIYRIIASFDQEVNIEKYISKSMKINLQFWDEFLSCLDKSILSCLAVDILLLCALDISNTSRKKYEKTADILQLINVGKEDMDRISGIARAIIEQDFDKFVRFVQPTAEIPFGRFISYFDGIDYTDILSSMDLLKNAGGKILIANATISKNDEIINLSDSCADIICFRNCSFQFIRGIKNEDRTVIFEDCVFEGNAFNAKESNNTHSDCEGDYIFIEGNHLQFKRTKFINCHVSKCVLKIEKSSISECEFLDCEGKNIPCSYLFEISDTNVDNSIFNNCSVRTSTKDRYDIYGGILLVKRGKITNNDFNKCIAYGDSRAYYEKYEMQIVCAEKSFVTENRFIKCNCSLHDDSGKEIGVSYIIGLKDAIEDKNNFDECSSYQCSWLPRRVFSNDNVGHLS